MTSDSKQRYRELIRKGVEATGRDDAEGRRLIYDKLRFANEAMLARKGTAYTATQSADVRRALEEAITEYEDEAVSLSAHSDRPEETAPAGPLQSQRVSTNDAGAGSGYSVTAMAKGHGTVRRRPSAWPFALMGAVAALAATAILGWLLLAAGAVSLSFDRAKIARGAMLERYLVTAEPAVQDAATFLDKIRDAVVKRQKEDPEGLTALSGSKYVALATFDGGLQRQLPKSLPRGSGVNLRANATGYKILFNYALCPAVKLLRPELLDPVRDVEGVACGGFGLWNTAGEKF